MLDIREIIFLNFDKSPEIMWMEGYGEKQAWFCIGKQDLVIFVY